MRSYVPAEYSHSHRLQNQVIGVNICRRLGKGAFCHQEYQRHGRQIPNQAERFNFMKINYNNLGVQTDL